MARRVLIPALLFFVACTSSVSIPKTKVRSDQPDAAAEYYAMRRAGSDDPQRSLAAARDRMRTMTRYATIGDRVLDRRTPGTDAATNAPFGKWQFLGPGNVGGRTRVVLIDKNNPELMYAAGVSGGIWKSVSGGNRWTPVGDDLMNVAVNSMVIDPSNSNVLYAGTGEGYFRENERGTALPLRGNGIFVSRDQGETWEPLASTINNENFHWVNDLVVSTRDSKRIYAATRTGVWRSDDSGATWNRVLATTVRGGCLDLLHRTDTEGDYLFASCGTFEQATVYRNPNAQSDPNWAPVLSEPNMGRTTLALAPSNPSVVYALSASNEPGVKNWQGILAVWRSDSNGDAGSWVPRVTNKSADIIGSRMLTNLITVDNDVCGGASEQPITMGWYCNTIAVDPADPNKVWVGGVDLFRSDDGGQTWGVASYWWAEDEPTLPFVHADQHTIVFHPNYDGRGNRIAYFGNDGGVFRTEDARGAIVHGKDALCGDQFAAMQFRPMNRNYGVTQFYHGAVFPDGRTWLGGTQDNGTILGTIEDGPEQWRRVAGGDGGYVAIDPANPRVVFAESQGAAVYLSQDGGYTFRPWRSGLEGQFLFIAPIALDPTDGNVWLGGTSLWRSVKMERWTRASAPVPENSAVSAVAIAPANPNRVIAGTSKGHILRSDAAVTTNASTAWSDVKPRAGFVSSLIFDPVDPNVAYATYAGFGGTHVWKSIDAGATWTPLDGIDNGALPDIPVHSLAVDPTRRERLYLGTDLGVFVSLDGGAHWSVENSGFAAVVTEHVTIAQGAFGPAIYAFTHGRGAWRAELTEVGPRRRGVRH